ncbi:MAG: tetratricopeptide repeat protein [Sporocytophaga sp.]|nr:tetratricopeptide repeat protein [Sporocytophaga sp.]
MKNVITFTFTILLYSFSYGQKVTELYNSKDYKELVKLEKKADKLTSEELYMVGYAFFQLENDDKAIEFYDKAIAKGLDNGFVHFHKGVSLCYQEKYVEALKEIDIALKKEPNNQEFMNQKGQIYRYQGQEDKALDFFIEATKLPNTFGEPFFWVAYIYHGKQDFKKALELYYEALDKVSPHNSYYITTLQSIGQLEFTYTKNYKKSANAYTKAIALNPKDYEYYPKLIKAYNAGKEYAKADSVFDLMKIAYKRKELSEDDMKYKNIAIDESDWNGQKVAVWKYLVDPEETLDISYKVYLLTKAGDKVERTFMIEKTIELPNGPKHLLCEKDKKTGSHFTYPYGWKTDTIPLDDLKKAIELVLEGKMKPSASSSFGTK